MNLLGLDFGTSSLKAGVYDENLKLIDFYSADYSPEIHGNRVEFDAEEYARIFFKAFETLSSRCEINALSIDTQCETMIVADENGISLRKAIVWLDGRAVEEASEIETRFGRKKVYDITGQAEITATWPASKLLWIKKNEKDIFSRIKKVFLLEDFLLFRLTGRFATEKTLQSSTIYFNINNGGWWDDMLGFIGISPAVLPELHESGEIIGTYKGISVVTGAIDQIAGAIGSGSLNRGTISEMTGTALAVFKPVEAHPAFDPDSRIPCHYVSPGNWCLLPWVPAAGLVLKWFKNSFCENLGFSDLDILACTVSPGSDGLIMLPHICGSTVPEYNPDAKGVFYGITPAHDRAHFIRAVLEAVAFMLKDCIDSLGGDIAEIRSTGGGASSPLWCRIKADVTGCSVVTLKCRETACLGSAILAGCAMGVFGSVKEASDRIAVENIYLPGSADYSEFFKQYKDLDSLLNRKGAKI